jgi:hypothetical protein
MAIYILRNGEPQGPYEESVVAEWLKAGTCSAQDLAWRHGMRGWQSLGTIPLKTKGLGRAGIVAALAGVFILGAISLSVIVVGIWFARKPTNFNSPNINEAHNGGRGGRADTTPPFLLQGWIQPIAPNSVTTYDFTQTQAAGRRTVEIRNWVHMGTLGWQINGSGVPADYTADEDEISFTSPTAGYSREWRIVERHPDRIVVQDKRGGTSFTLFNCTADGWPDLIRASTRGCR